MVLARAVQLFLGMRTRLPFPVETRRLRCSLIPSPRGRPPPPAGRDRCDLFQYEGSYNSFLTGRYIYI